MLGDASPNGLKYFNETAHVEELKKRAPIFHSILQASAFKRKGSQSDSKHGVSPQCAISVAAAALLRARCPQMSVQSYRLALVLWQMEPGSKYVFYVFMINCRSLAVIKMQLSDMKVHAITKIR